MAIVFNPFTGTFDFTGSGGASGITVGTTTITSGTNGRILYDNAGVVGEATVTGTLGSVVLSDSPSLTTVVTLTRTSVGTTSADGIVLTNTTAAAAGAQQYSPRLRLTGQGWKTNATAASQTVDWASEVQPVQGSANPTSYLSFLHQTNGGGYLACASLYSDSTGQSSTAGGRGRFAVGGNSNPGTWSFISSGYGAGQTWVVYSYAKEMLALDGQIASVQCPSDAVLGWSSTGSASGAADLKLSRDAAAVLALKNSTTAQTFRVYGTTTGSKYTSVLHNGTDGTINTSAGKLNLSAFAGSTTYVGNDSAGSSIAVSIGGSTQTATSGTYIVGQALGTFNPSSTSTMVAVGFYVNPTINYAAGTPGAGSYEALKIAAVETALPTGGNYLIRASSGATGFTDRFLVDAAVGAVTGCAGTAIPAGGTTGAGLKVSSTANFGVFFGSGAPSLSAAKGSLYLRSDGSGTTDRAYVNTDGGTTWTVITTSAQEERWQQSHSTSRTRK